MRTQRVIREDDRLVLVSPSPDRRLMLGIAGLSGVIVVLWAWEVGWSTLHTLTAGVVLVLGFAALTLAHVTDLDRTNGTYRTGRLCMGWWRSRRGPLDALHGVSLVWHDGRGFAVLLGMTAERVLTVWLTHPGDIRDPSAREIAQEVATFTGLDLNVAGEPPG